MAKLFAKIGDPDQVELQWLEHLWDHRKLFETWVIRVTEGKSWCQVRKQIAII